MKKTIMKYIQGVGKVLEWAVLLVLLAVFFILLSPLLPTKQYVQTYVISTGSMEPTLPVGTVAFTRPIEASQVNEKDIIAFASPLQNDKTIMHRVIEKTEEGGEWQFRTKGDNNNAPDNWVVQESNVKGLMVYQVPYIGHIVSFIKTKVGFAVAIVIPALLLIISQIRTIKEGIEEEIEKRIQKKVQKSDQIMPVIVFFLLSSSALFLMGLQNAHAFLSDQVVISGITISVKDFVAPDRPMHLSPVNTSEQTEEDVTFDWTDVLDFENQNNPVYYIFQWSTDVGFSSVGFTSSHLNSSEITINDMAIGTYYWRVRACDAIDNCSLWTDPWSVSVNEVTEPGDTPGDVVINELMWMGSTEHSHDEWLELRNMTNSAISLTGWTIDNGGSGAGDDITLSGTIPANGFFLITDRATDVNNAAIADSITSDLVKSDMSLHNDGEVLTLKNSAGTVIDSTPTGAWAEGVNGTLKQSMERNSIPGDGSLPGSWHTCISDGCNDTTFWDSEGNNYGTPKAANLSENDSSLRLANALVPTVEEPQANFYLRSDQKAVGFTVSNVDRFDSLDYEITYQTKGTLRAMVGTLVLTGEDTVTRANLVLGSCSSQGEVCTYDTDITDLSLSIHLLDGKSEVVIEKSL